MVLTALLTALGALASPAWGQAKLPLDFRRDPGWQPRPSFLPNPAQRPRVEARDGATELIVDEPGRGMKFELPLVPFSSAGGEYLTLRYRAGGLQPGYAIWAANPSGPGRELINTRDLKADGEWHTLALDLATLGETDMIRAILTDVECGGPPARIAFERLWLTDEPPPGADVWPRERPEKPDFVVKAGELPLPQARPAWLTAPTNRHQASVEGGALRLRAEGAGMGMKWSTPLANWPDLSVYRYVAVRYRTRGMAKFADYFLWLGSEAGGMPQKTAQPVTLDGVEEDGQWHAAIFTLNAPFAPVEMAFQVQCRGASAEAWIDSLRFTVTRPLLRVADVMPLEEGYAGSHLPLASARMVELASPDGIPSERRLRRFGLTGWPAARRVTARGIPFLLAQSAPITPPDINQTLSLPVRGTAREVYLLMAARLPALDYSGVLDGRPMRRFDNPERFVARVTYADGVAAEIFPLRVEAGRYEVAAGMDVYGLSGLRPKPLRSLTLRNRMDSAVFMVGGVTLNTGRPLMPHPAVAGLPPPAPERTMNPGAGSIEPVKGGFRVGTDLLILDIRTEGGIALRGMENGCLRGGTMRVAPGPLFALGIGDKLVPSTQVAAGTPTVGQRPNGEWILTVPVDATGAGVPLKGEFVVTAGDGPDIRMELRLTLTGDKPATPVVHFPLVSGVQIGSAHDTWYLWCRKGGWVNRVPCSDRQRYGGQYPLQVADFFNPALGGGLSLATYDTRNIYKTWGLDKDEHGGNWRIEYFPREYRPGETIEIAPTALRAHTGDWRAALKAYRRWVATWYRPQVPRKPWFQKCFNYRQHYAWSDLRDQTTGRWRMQEVIAADRAFFGCLDYLHIFDFGQSQKYGRVGDYNHYDELGGREAIAGAIASAERAGVRVGLYIEGYLCDRNSVWGRDNVLKYGIRQADGKPLLWAGDSTEYMMCPATGGWRNHLAETYHRVAGELGPNGMYIDQYGFLDTWKICYSREHGHPVPVAPNRGEEGTLRAIRAAVPPTIATLTEETPCDWNSQFQDGSLGYSVAFSDPEMAPHRADLFRFQFPDFKVFQLVSYNDFLEGGWHMLKGPFFNGEGTWLQNPVPGGFCPDARDFLRRAFAVLHRYADAFTSPDVEALVPTLLPTLYANRFTGKRLTVWTLYNGDWRTVRGEALRLPARPNARYLAAFTGREIRPRRAGNSVFVPVTIGPHDVGCIVEERE